MSSAVQAAAPAAVEVHHTAVAGLDRRNIAVVTGTNTRVNDVIPAADTVAAVRLRQFLATRRNHQGTTAPTAPIQRWLPVDYSSGICRTTLQKMTSGLSTANMERSSVEINCHSSTVHKI